MEATRQNGIEITGRQKARMSSWRMSFIVVMGLTVFYVVWGIAKMIL